MAGVRKTIYVPDEELWDKFVIKANEQGKSVSSYLMDSGNSQMDRIESKLDLLLERGQINKAVQPDKYESHKPKEESLKKELIEAQKKSEKRLESEPIKSDKAILKDILENKVFETDKLVEKAIKLKSEKKATIQGSFFNPTPKKS